jgi:hypothetical protein
MNNRKQITAKITGDRAITTAIASSTPGVAARTSYAGGGETIKVGRPAAARKSGERRLGEE